MEYLHSGSTQPQMISIAEALYVVVKEMPGERAPRPLPLSSGFSEHVAYRVLGVHSPSETGEAYLILSNDRDEMWFISNRHFRTWELRPQTNALRLPLSLEGTVSLDSSHLSH